MGLGGYLLWTPVAREIKKATGQKDLKFLPVEQRGHFIKPVISDVFKNNEDFLQEKISSDLLFPLILNNPKANYCKQDTPTKAYHRKDKHIIAQFCEVYGIENPELKCYLKSDSDDEVKTIVKNKIGNEPFITIEPMSKVNYTPNRVYDFEKWQAIVDHLSKKVKIAQVGNKGSRLLDNVIDLTGITTFNNTAGIIGESKLFLSSEGGLVHAATAFDTKSIVVITGYQSEKMVAYPQNFNVNISKHIEPCGLKINCDQCKKDRERHNISEIIEIAENYLCL